MHELDECFLYMYSKCTVWRDLHHAEMVAGTLVDIKCTF